MKNKDGDGIICSYCRNERKDDFIYYSFDFHQISFNKVPVRSRNVVYTCDMCEQCMEAFNKRLLEVAKQVKQSPDRCDVTGQRGLDASKEPSGQ